MEGKYIFMEAYMRGPRQLAENVWYKVHTQINVGEPIFQLEWAKTLFHQVLIDATGRFSFGICGLTIENDCLLFYIKPADGLELPKIMQWVKQTFAVRLNFRTGRKGHVWGDRYSSEILAGDPPPGAKKVDWAVINAKAETKIPAAITYELIWDSPRPAGMGSETCFSPQFTFSSEPPPG
jgi:hypothetical protein